MNQDDIIRMAQVAGFGPAVAWPEAYPPFERFFHAAYAAGAAAEREACAKVCEETDLVDYEHCMVLHTDGHATLRNAAAAIRARGEPLNRDEIIRLARKADGGFETDTFHEESLVGMDAIERFASLVAAAEREACAVAGGAAAMAGHDYMGVAAAIRARGETK